MGAAAIPLVVSALGAGASYYNTQQTAKKQDKALADQIMGQRQRQTDANRIVNETLEGVAGSNAEAERASAMEQYNQQLRRNSGAATGTLGGVGALSSRFGQDAADAAGDIAAYGTGTADIFSRIDAPIMQRRSEGIDFARAGNQIGIVQDLAGGDNYIGELRRRSITRNPWLDAFSQAAQGYGSTAGGG
jgi:hypothetical protein